MKCVLCGLPCFSVRLMCMAMVTFSEHGTTNISESMPSVTRRLVIMAVLRSLTSSVTIVKTSDLVNIVTLTGRLTSSRCPTIVYRG